MGDKVHFTDGKTGAQRGTKAGMGGLRLEQASRGAHFSLSHRNRLVSHWGNISFCERLQGYRELCWEESWKKKRDTAETASGSYGAHPYRVQMRKRCLLRANTANTRVNGWQVKWGWISTALASQQAFLPAHRRA